MESIETYLRERGLTWEYYGIKKINLDMFFEKRKENEDFSARDLWESIGLYGDLSITNINLFVEVFDLDKRFLIFGERLIKDNIKIEYLYGQDKFQMVMNKGNSLSYIMERDERKNALIEGYSLKRMFDPELDDDKKEMKKLSDEITKIMNGIDEALLEFTNELKEKIYNKNKKT